MPSNKGKIVEAIVVDNKTVDRPNDNDSVGVEEKEYTVYDLFNLLNELNAKMDRNFDMTNKWLEERAEMMDKQLEKMDKQNAMLDDMISDVKGFNNKLEKQNEEWRRDRYQIKKNTEVELIQVSGDNAFDNSEEIINQVSDNSNNELINNSGRE